MTHPIHSVIDRRLLVNVRMDAEVARRLLPDPLEPLLIGGSAVAGVCFLRLRDVRPAGFPRVGVTLDNVAHRIAVTLESADGAVPGVFVPRRDTTSRLAAVLGGRLIEGVLSRASFEVLDSGDRLSIRVHGPGSLRIEVTARATTSPGSELFRSIEDESEFFQQGPIAYSPNSRRGVLEAVELECPKWVGTPMTVEHFGSSILDDTSTFPPGSWSLDSAMVVRNLNATWRSAVALSSEPIGVGTVPARS